MALLKIKPHTRFFMAHKYPNLLKDKTIEQKSV